MPHSDLVNYFSRKFLGKRLNDIELPPSGPPDPRLKKPDYGEAGRRMKEGLRILKEKGYLNKP